MYKRLLIVVVASNFLIGSFASMDAFANGEQHTKNPIKLIWQKLMNHEERIVDLEEQPSTSGVEVYVVPDILVPVGVEISQVVSCPEGKVVLSGGHSVINLSGIRPVSSTNLVASAPSIDPNTGLPTGWLVTFSANQADNLSLTVYAVCASSAP